MHILTVPPAAQRDEKAVQMLSAWIAEKGLHCSLNIGVWEEQGHSEPRAWGILLADVIRHIGNALEQERGVDAESTIADVMESLLSELEESTSETSGGFHPGHS